MKDDITLTINDAALKRLVLTKDSSNNIPRQVISKLANLLNGSRTYPQDLVASLLLYKSIWYCSLKFVPLLLTPFVQALQNHLSKQLEAAVTTVADADQPNSLLLQEEDNSRMELIIERRVDNNGFFILKPTEDFFYRINCYIPSQILNL